MQPADTLATVAKRAGISEEQLREANRIPPRYRLAPGSTILIPRDETMERHHGGRVSMHGSRWCPSLEPAQGDIPRAPRRHAVFGGAPLPR